MKEQTFKKILRELASVRLAGGDRLTGRELADEMLAKHRAECDEAHESNLDKFVLGEAERALRQLSIRHDGQMELDSRLPEFFKDMGGQRVTLTIPENAGATVYYRLLIASTGPEIRSAGDYYLDQSKALATQHQRCYEVDDRRKELGIPDSMSILDWLKTQSNPSQ